MNNQDHEGICPFFIRDRGLNCSKKYCVTCEGCSFKFPDNITRREFLYRFCAHPDGYKNCTMYKVLCDYYNRLYSN